MKAYLNHNLNWLMRFVLILVNLFVFQISIINVFASSVNLGLNPHSPILETYTYDKIECSVGAEVKLKLALSKSETGSESESVLLNVREAAKGAGKFLKFGGDEAVVHFGKHGNSVMSALGKKSYNLANYIDDAIM